jgi:DNA polymerase III delta subunit
MLRIDFKADQDYPEVQASAEHYRKLWQELGSTVERVARQVTGLWAARSGRPIPGAPYAQKQIAQQAKHWTLEEITWFIHELAELEDKLKTGRSSETWWQGIDRLLVRLYDR